MIKLDIVEKNLGTNGEGKRVLQVSLDADTAAEVIANGTSTANIEDMPSDAVLAPFSSCFTADKKLGILNSAGEWNF